MTSEQQTHHHGPGRLAAYLDGILDHEERAEFEAHLAECHACRNELTEVHRLLAKRRPAQRAFAWTVGAAAVLALLWAGFGPAGETPQGVLRDRTDLLDRVAPIEILAPTEGSVTDRDSLRFVWRPREPRALYSLTISDRSGDIVWQVRTRDTLVTLPTRAPIRPGGTYYWFVDALLDGAAVSTTDVVEFRVGR